MVDAGADGAAKHSRRGGARTVTNEPYVRSYDCEYAVASLHEKSTANTRSAICICITKINELGPRYAFNYHEKIELFCVAEILLCLTCEVFRSAAWFHEPQQKCECSRQLLKRRLDQRCEAEQAAPR